MTREEQFDKIRQEMAEYTPEQVQDAVHRMPYALNSAELDQHISSIKNEIKNQATPEEIDTAFKNFRL